MKQVLQELFMQERLAKVEQYLSSAINFKDNILKHEFNKILTSGGKRLRPALLLLVAEYFNNNDSDVIVAASMMELIHMASLIHDDINDKSNLRRGSATINATYGDDVATHMGDFLLMETLLKGYDAKSTRLILSTIAYLAIEMSKGEFAQIHSYFQLSQTIEDYYYRIERKTAILIAESCKLGALLSSASPQEVESFYQYGYHLGLAFQIKDDLMDLSSETTKLGKPIGNDLKQGLLNLPLLLILDEDFPEKEKVVSIIENKFMNSDSDLAYVNDIIVKYNGIERSYEILLQHINKAKEALKNLKPNSILRFFYDGADYVQMRKI